MRQNQQNKQRMRGRNRKGPNPLTRSFESNGPDLKIRGTALHIAEKYTQLARDASSSGDRVMAENYLQHAEHYYRIIATAQAALLTSAQFGRDDLNDDGEEDLEPIGSDRFEPRQISITPPNGQYDNRGGDYRGQDREGGNPQREPYQGRESYQQREPREGGYQQQREPREGGYQGREPREGYQPREPREHREGGYQQREPREGGYQQREPRGGYQPREGQQGGDNQQREPRENLPPRENQPQREGYQNRENRGEGQGQDRGERRDRRPRFDRFDRRSERPERTDRPPEPRVDRPVTGGPSPMPLDAPQPDVRFPEAAPRPAPAPQSEPVAAIATAPVAPEAVNDGGVDADGTKRPARRRAPARPRTRRTGTDAAEPADTSAEPIE
jgi:hypothetical protein